MQQPGGNQIRPESLNKRNVGMILYALSRSLHRLLLQLQYLKVPIPIEIVDIIICH